MDIIAHGLWSGAVYQAVKRKTKKPLNIGWAVFWGIFPDLFAFAIPFIWIWWSRFFGNAAFSFPRPGISEPPVLNSPPFLLAEKLYAISHSAIVFLVVFGIVYVIVRRPVWELGGWLFHVLIDIMTHTYRFFPTPFLWPISTFKLSGISWGAPWFMALNYGSIAVVYFFLYKFRKRNSHE